MPLSGPSQPRADSETVVETAVWTAIILAGQRPEGDPLASALDQKYKALIPVAGRSMLARVADTLLASSDIDRVVILAQEPERLLTGDAAWIDEEPRIALAASHAGIAASVAAVAGSNIAPWPVLVTTADHALLTPEMVDAFLNGVGESDIAVGLGERRSIEARYPTTRRTWLKFSDGHYSGANLFALRNARAVPALELWAGVERHRKKAWKIMTRFGPWLLLRALTRSISLGEALRKAGERLGATVRPVILPQPEATIDVDKLADLELVEAILAQRAGNPPDDDCPAV